MTRFYKVREFAEITGVTVKALHHYDRLGLLKPRRTDGGYRIYSEADLERLEQIVALSFIGLPLKRVGALLDRGTTNLSDALRLQRQALEEKRRLLACAIEAIIEAEKAVRPGEPSDPAIFRKLILAMGLKEFDVTQYFSEDALAKMKQFYERTPSEEWIEEWKKLRVDILTVIDEDPCGETGQALARRWRALMQRAGGALSLVTDPEVVAGLKKAGGDSRNWPPGLLRRFQDSSVAKVVPFILKATAAIPPEA